MRFKQTKRLCAGGFKASDLLRQPCAPRVEINLRKSDAP
jgi:hypothetical protein